jgi:large subunit ribosomal protein L3
MENMLNAILAEKIKMSQSFVEGARIPITEVVAGPCVVTQIKKDKQMGYWSIQIGFGKKKIKNTSKPLQGHLKKIIKKEDKYAPRYLREIRVSEEPKLQIGDVINLSDVFKEGDFIEVTGISKGKGFAGVVKRHHFAGGPKTHGQSDRLRAPGSIGQGTTPGRVYKGKRMAGKMGREKVTVKNLQIISIDKEKNKVDIRGPVPGRNRGLLLIRKT